MVDAGEVYAQIDEAASTVRFLQDPDRYDSAGVVKRLDSQIKRAIALGNRIRTINNKVSIQPQEFLCTWKSDCDAELNRSWAHAAQILAMASADQR